MGHSIIDIRKKYLAGQKLTMLTCYDYTFAKLVDAAGLDIVLVGDSLGMVIKGDSTTVNVSIDDMCYHVAAVKSANPSFHIVGDMPFLSASVTVEKAVEHAGALIRAGAESVKIEGGQDRIPAIEAVIRAGIPVMGHVGLLPQSYHTQGGFKVQGRDAESGQRIVDDALALEGAGVYALVVEGVPAEVARTIQAQVDVPTIGIGAGVDCDGQVLVLQDVLGLNPDFQPKFVRTFLDGAELITTALKEYVDSVHSASFPSDAETFGLKKDTPLNMKKGSAGHGYGASD